MLSSAADGGKPSRSASAVVATTESGYHIFRIDGYTRTKGLKSLPFTVGGHNWQIGYYPNGKNSVSADYISLSLYLDESVTVPVCSNVSVSSTSWRGKLPSMAMEVVCTFGSHVGFGNPQFMKRGDLEKSKYLTGDSFSIRCDIAILGEFLVVETVDAATPPVISVPPSDLHRHFGELLQTEEGADVVFEVGGEKMAAHRCVLAARSPVFSAELFGKMKESDIAVKEVYTFGCHVGFGNPQFMKRGDLEKSKYLTGDSFSIRCDIAVLGEFHAATPPVISVPPSDLHRHFGELLQTEKGADVMFEVGGEKVVAHRCVLVARSVVFSAELFGTMKESDTAGAGVIYIDDMEAQVLKTLLYFVYTDSLPKINKDDH
ncbi:hypothetical protein EJB05_22804, partial [Eragrostis curvula]